jgi:hypothetical protein
MPGQTEIDLEFADGTYSFALKLPQILELQRVCGAGIFAIYGRVLKGRYLLNGQSFGAPHECEAFADDVYATIRLGLIGGGGGLVNGQTVEVNALRAKQLVETYAHTAPLAEPWAIAAAILSAKIEGYEPQKKSPVTTGEEGATG